MGNSTSEIVSRVSGSSYEESKKLLNQDIELLHDTSIVSDLVKLTTRSDLSCYKTGTESSITKEALTTENEESLIFSHYSQYLAQDRIDPAVLILIKDISQNTEIDASSAAINKRLQAFCRIFEAILRIEDNKKKKSAEGLAESLDDQLPAAAVAAIKFGLSTLLNLIECVANINPQLFGFFIADANTSLSEAQPLSLLTSDATLLESFEKISGFFDSVICGKIKSLLPEITIQALIPFFKLALASGSISCFLMFIGRLFGLKDLSPEIKSALFPLLKSLNSVPISSNLHKWSPEGKGDHIEINEDVVFGGIDNEDGVIYLDHEYLNSKVYFEIQVNKVNENCHFGISVFEFSEKSTWNNSSFQTIAFGSNSSVYTKTDESFKIEPWAVNDKIGIFVDLEQKSVFFYKNKEKQKHPPIVFKEDKYKIYLHINKNSEFTLNRNVDYPADLRDILLKTKPNLSDFQNLLGQASPPDEYFSKPLGEILAFILKKLSDGLIPVEYLFATRNYKFENKRPTYSFQLSVNTFKYLQEIQSILYNLLYSSDFSFISEASLKSSISYIQRLIMYHFLLSEQLEDTSLNEEIKKKILDQTIQFVQTSNRSGLSSQAIQLLSSCFEIFYKDPSVKLKYINEGLERDGSQQELRALEALEANVFQTIARADILFPMFHHTDESHVAEIKRFYTNLLQKSQKATEGIIKSDYSKISILKLLNSAQAALFSQTGKNEFKGKYLEVISDYSIDFLKAARDVLQNCQALLILDKSEEMISKIASSMIGSILEELLCSLVLTPLNTKLISEVIPLVSEISALFSRVPVGPSVLTSGLGIIEEIYESPHNYLDNSQLKHIIKIPSAIKYNLVFDPQCKTENGCDYLELWLDEAGTNKFARWEGENFPKEPVEVTNPLLHFTFRSDGSVNYWGWKINIKATVEASFFKKQWPEPTKDNIELFFGKCSAKMINGELEELAVEEDVDRSLKNPLFEYGIRDSALAFVSNLPELNENILKISGQILRPTEYLVNPALSKFNFTLDYEIGLKEYLDQYVGVKEKVFSDNQFYCQLLDGHEDLASAWKTLRKRSGVLDTSFSGDEEGLDQAERAVFSVYSSFFEIGETVKKILKGELQPGPTLKAIVKETCLINIWAQKHKQKQFESGKKDVTFKSISNQIIKKCGILIGTDFKNALSQIGVSKMLKNLTSSLAKNKQENKSKNSQDALKKLKSLISIKQNSTLSENEDLRDLSIVSELIRKFLENPAPVEKIIEAINHRRTVAIIKTLGFLSISKIISYSSSDHETFIVKSFTDSLKSGNSKMSYLKNTAGIDPFLIQCIQKSFFLVIKSIQEDMIASAHSIFDLETFSHFISCIDSLSWPYRGEDIYQIIPQPLTAFLKTLLKWAKGDVRQEPIKRDFLIEKCVKKMELITSDKFPEGKTAVLIEKHKKKSGTYLVLDFSGDLLPIIDYEVSEEPKEGLEETVPEFLHKGVSKRIYIKRAEPAAGNRFLTGIDEDLQGKFEKHEDLLEEANPEEVKKMAKVKENLSKNSWNLFKQLAYTLLGAWKGASEENHLAIQEKFLKVIFDELQEVYDTGNNDVLSVKNLIAGTWVGSGKVMRNKVKEVDTWIEDFSDDKQPELADIINSYYAYIDPLGIGSVGSPDCGYLADRVEEFREGGQVNFFKFLDRIKETVNEVEGLELVKKYIQEKEFWNKREVDTETIEYSDIQAVLIHLEKHFVPSEENLFAPYLSALKEFNGLVPPNKIPENTVPEFKDKNDNIDLYHILTVIKNTPKFSDYYSEIKDFYCSHKYLPTSLDDQRSSKSLTNDYFSSLLLVLYGCFTSSSISKTLSRPEYIRTLMSYVLTPSCIPVFILSLRILSKVLPSHYTPSTLSELYSNLQTDPAYPCLATYLLNQLGRSIIVTEDQRLGYEYRNLLISLLQENTWKDHISKILLLTHSKAIESLDQGLVLDCIQIGSILLLSNSFYTAKVPFILSTVSLRESSFGWGIVKEVQPDGKVSVYSLINDTSASVELNKIVSIDNSVNYCSLKLMADTLAEICENLFILWRRLNESFSRRLNTNNEGFVIFSLVYKTLRNVVLACLLDAIQETDLDNEKIGNIVLDLIGIQPSNEDVSINDHLNAVTKIKEKIESLNSEEINLKNEEVEGYVNSLEDDIKNAYQSLVNQGLSPQFALKCVKAEIMDVEGAKNYKEVVQSTLLTKLSFVGEEIVAVEDPDGLAEIYQNNYFHLIISDTHNSYKSLEFDISSKIFDSLTYFTDEVTIRLGIETAPLDGALKTLMRVGNLELLIDHESISIKDSSFKLDTTQIFTRIHAKSNGEVKFVLENTNESVDLFERSVFTGYSLGKFKLILESGTSASIVMLEIHNLNVCSNFEGHIEKTAKSDLSERFVKIKTKLPNSTIPRLKLLGISEQEAEICRSSTSNFSDAVKHSLKHFAPTKQFSVASDIISEIKLFEKTEDVPADFVIAKVLENLKESDFQIPGFKVLAYKKSASDSGLLALGLEETAGLETLGELNPGDEKVLSLYKKSGKTSQNDQAVSSLVFIKSASVYNVQVPRNYLVLSDKDRKAINIAPKSDPPYCLFIAYCKQTEFLSVPVYKLENIPSTSTAFGLVESQKSSSDRKEKEKDLSSYTLTGLFYLLISFEQNSLFKLSESFIFSSIMKSSKNFKSFTQVVQIDKVFEHLTTDFVKSLELDEDLAVSLMHESLKSILSTLVPNFGSSKKLNSIQIESTHPYDNNMDVDSVIHIPGASGLRIEFDPQCYTEANCDILRFYESPNRKNELKSFSGQGEAIWLAFEVPGDTVHTYFHSDGSVNYWGYKFDVIPIGSSANAENTNVSVALEILLKMANANNLKNLIKTDKVLFPLFGYLLGSSRLQEKLQVLEIFKLTVEGFSSDLGSNILEYLNRSAEVLHKNNLSDKANNTILQALIELLLEVQKLGIAQLNLDWLLDLNDLLSDMSGLADKGKSLDMFLFDVFVGNSGNKIELAFESEHPYLVKTQVKKISFKGAHSLSIEFSKDSKAENHHTVFFSKNKLNPLNALSTSSSNSGKGKWEVKGPDIEFSNNGFRVTRTNSNSWGAALMPLVLLTGTTSFTYLIEQDGSSDYLYIGFIQTKDLSSIELNSCFNSDLGKKLWTWKKTGDVHVQGSNVKVAGFVTGDVIKMTVNFALGIIKCFKNNQEVHEFKDVAPPLVPLISFGGSNQFVQLKGVENDNDVSLEEKKVSILGHKTFMWFPVYSGYFSSYQWDYTTDEACSLSSNRLVLNKLNENDLLVPVQDSFQSGKHYFQVLIKKGGHLGLGVGASDQVNDKNWKSEEVSIIWSDQEPGFKEGDVVGVLLDFENKILEFFINRKSVTRLEGKVDQRKFRFFAVLKSQNSEIEVKNEEPDWLDILKVDTDRTAHESGYKIKVFPEFKGRSWNTVELILGNSPQAFRESWEAYRNTFSEIFKSGAAEEFMTYLEQFCITNSKDPIALTQEDLSIKRPDLVYYPALEKVENSNIFKLYQILLNFNKRVQSSLNLFDLNFKASPTEMQQLLINSKSYIMFGIKNSLFKAVIDKTKNDTRTEINLDKVKIEKFKNKKIVDITGQFSLFGQVFRALSMISHAFLRNSERIYKINYRGEGTVDDSGPYNESISGICDELMSSVLRLLLPTSNNSNNIGESRNAWIVNPSATSQTELKMFRFLGKLIGAAIRTQNNLNLSFPPLFWKTLLKEKLTAKDLKSADSCTAQIIEILKNPAENSLTPENFSKVFEGNFTAEDSSGRAVELTEGGSSKKVTFDNCGEFADLVLETRLKESQNIYSVIREGLSAVVPIDYLNLMSSKQLENLVCGPAGVDVDVLKENTEYEGFLATDPLIVMFWEVLKAFTPRDRSLFLNFVWARPKLPPGKDWRRMKIKRLETPGPANNYLPVGQSCCFVLELPVYVSKEELEQKIIYAITHCSPVDLDGEIVEVWED